MIVRVDVSTVPPRVEVRDAHDLTALETVVSAPPHTWINPDLLEGAARRAGADEAAFASMLEFATRHGWVDDAGRIRAHVAVASARTNHTEGDPA